jgi:hypothetical protein
MLLNSVLSRIVRAAAVLASFVLMAITFSVAADDSSLTWIRLKLANGPSARASFAAAYDPVSRKVVVFGGHDVNQQFNETWTFDGTTWTQINTSTAPSARSASSMAYDYHIRKLVLFGGGGGFVRLQDTWLWDGATSTWTQANPQTVPPAASGPVLFSDPANGHVIMFGGYRGKFYSRDTYLWTGTDWQLLSPSVSPYPRSVAVVGYDPIRKKEVLFGGVSDNWVVQNTWTWTETIGPRRRPPRNHRRYIRRWVDSIPRQMPSWFSAAAAKA